MTRNVPMTPALRTTRMLLPARLVGLALLTCGAAAVAHAGSPLQCFPFEIDRAASLPFETSQGWNGPRSDYDRSRLVADTLSLLGPTTPTLVRMETIRRATVYVSSDAKQAKALFEAIRRRSEEARPAEARLAEFDLGYLIETYKQAHSSQVASSLTGNTDGRALIVKAAEATKDPAMAYAVALSSFDARGREVRDAHLRRAVEGAPEGSALARTITAHARLWGAASIAELKDRARSGRLGSENR